jgi:hypothetical protein
MFELREMGEPGARARETRPAGRVSIVPARPCPTLRVGPAGAHPHFPLPDPVELGSDLG